MPSRPRGAPDVPRRRSTAAASRQNNRLLRVAGRGRRVPAHGVRLGGGRAAARRGSVVGGRGAVLWPRAGEPGATDRTSRAAERENLTPLLRRKRPGRGGRVAHPAQKVYRSPRAYSSFAVLP